MNGFVFPPRANTVRFAALALVGPILAGCCTGVTTDPRRGGLAGGVCGATTGAYDQRLVDRQNELASLDDSRRRLERSLATSGGEARDLERRVGEARVRAEDRASRVRALDADIARLEASKQLSRAEHDALQAEIAQLDREVSDLMARARGSEMAARALREGAIASADRSELQAAEARDRQKGEELDRRLARLKQRSQRPSAE